MDTSINSLNQEQLKKLLIAVKINSKRMGLILAIADDINLRADITDQYEVLLQKAGFESKRIWIETEQPSLYHTLSTIQNESDNLVVTVLGTNELRSISIAEDRSEQDEFFFSLQWT